MAKKAAPKAAKKADMKKPAGPKPATKAEIFSEIAEKTGLSKKDVSAVFDSISEMIGKHLSKKGAGVFMIPGLMKLTVKVTPATPEKPGINPFTKEPIIIKAKPASRKVTIKALKPLKDAVAK